MADKKTIVVTGDLLIDHHLVKPSSLPAGYGAPVDKTQQFEQFGGAWFLHDMVEAALSVPMTPPQGDKKDGTHDDSAKPAPGDNVDDAKTEEPPKPPPCVLFGPKRAKQLDDAPIGHANSVWSAFPRKKGDKDKVWRIADFVGSVAPAKLEKAKPVALVGAEEDAESSAPSIVVLDDVGLGFRTHKHLWPDEVSAQGEASEKDREVAKDKEGQEDKASGCDIVLKTNCFSKDNLLLAHLLDHHAKRLTLIVSADDLRARGAAISKGLSWDRTIEETVREFETGLSSCDLARARRVVVHFDGGSGAACFTRSRLKLGPPSRKAAQKNADETIRDRVCFERFLYLPDEVEGVWSDERPGKMFGKASIITASVVRHIVDPESYPLFVALGRALAASRYNKEEAGGGISNEEPSIRKEGIRRRLNWSPFCAKRLIEEKKAEEKEAEAAEGKVKKDEATEAEQKKDGAKKVKAKKGEDEKTEDEVLCLTLKDWHYVAKQEANWPKADPCSDYYSAFPHEVLTDPEWRQQPATESNLLRDAVGRGSEYYAAVAMDVVIRGPEKGLLRSVPKARYGKFMTVDREEIERINALRSLIETYRASTSDTRPLSISVFGPPGSGKSFAIKQLAAAMFGKDQQTLEFNLSQFADEDMTQLHAAFHRVRDASIKGSIPLVFWDEFDSDDLKWLKHFLAPMQDAEFRAGSGIHPFGKAIFVFAGGTCSTFEAFDRSNATDANVQTFFRGKKGPDFVSRLRGFVNIKGPNPSDPEYADSDPEHLIRRAMILRSMLERSYGDLLDSKTKMANVSTRVVRAFLRVERFLHGARSLESILSMSNLRDVTFFDVAELTTPELMGLHVSNDFVDLANLPEIETEIIEALSKAFHKGWRKMREDDKWTYDEKRDDEKKKHPLLVDFEQLSPEDKRKNYDPAIVTPAKLAQLGYCIRRRRATLSQAPAVAPWTGGERDELLEIEHDIWLRSYLMQGYEYADNATDYSLCRHRDIARFEDVPREDQELDEANIKQITPVLHEYGYELVKEC